LNVSKTTKLALKVFFALTTLILIILISVGVYLSTSANHFIKILTAQVEENTGRKLMAGEAEISLSLHPEIIITDVSLANAEWGSRKQMVTAERLKVKFSLFAFLAGEILFDEIHIVAPDFYFEKNAQGLANWNFIDVDLPIVNVDQLKVNEGQLYYKEDLSGNTFTFKIDHFQLQHLLKDSLQTVELKAEHLGHLIEITGKTGNAKSWLRNDPFVLDLNFKSNDIQAKVDGEITKPIDLQGLNVDLSLKAETLSSFSWLAKINLPKTGHFTLNARLSDQETGFGIEKFAVELGKASLSGSIEIITTKSQPKILAKLIASNFDTTDFKPSSQDESDSIFFDKPLPLSFLKEADADVSLSAKDITIFTVPAHNLSLKVLLNNGLLAIKPITAEIADGSFMADLSINAASQPAQVAADFHADQIDLGKLLKSLSGKAHLEGGKTDIDINISGQGNSTRALASSLNGYVYANTGEGLINYDLSLAAESIILSVLKKMNPMKEKKETTTLDCIVLRFDIADGIATIDKSLAYQSESLKVLGNGTIDFNNEKINILLSSKSTIATFLQLKGSLAKPVIVMNPVKALQKGTSLWAAIMTGGMSMAAEIVYDYVTSDENPCEIAQRDISATE
jgi:uncharacterized protein involved in outer membrane biogenesis